MISGGWLLVSNIVIVDSSPFQLSVETAYRGISNYHNNKMFLTKSAMNELRTHLPFTQLRFHCSKRHHGRTFHVTTAADSTGEAVVRYFSGQTNVQPDSCGSFVKMDDDNSGLAGICHKWETDDWKAEKIVFEVGKWGPPFQNEQQRLIDHLAFVAGKYHWVLIDDGSRSDWDDHNDEVSAGDFWKVFVR